MTAVPSAGLNLTQEEVREACGGYVYPARQLRELHARGFVLATLGKSGKVVLPRAHYLAVTSGQYGAQPEKAQPQQPARPNREALMRHFIARQKKR